MVTKICLFMEGSGVVFLVLVTVLLGPIRRTCLTVLPNVFSDQCSARINKPWLNESNQFGDIKLVDVVAA